MVTGDGVSMFLKVPRLVPGVGLLCNRSWRRHLNTSFSFCVSVLQYMSLQPRQQTHKVPTQPSNWDVTHTHTYTVGCLCKGDSRYVQCLVSLMLISAFKHDPNPENVTRS